MILVVTNREQAAVHLGMEGLYAAVHHLGKAGEFRYVHDLKPGSLDRRGRAAGGNQLDAIAGEPAREVDKAGLVENRNERARDAAQVGLLIGHGVVSGSSGSSPRSRRVVVPAGVT